MGKFYRIKSQAFFHCSIVQYTYKQLAVDLILLLFENRVIRLYAKYDHEEGKGKTKKKKKSKPMMLLK